MDLKIKHLAQITRKARKLYTGSSFSSSTWGHQACGFSDAMIVALERDALNSTGIKPAGRCRAVALVAAFGMQGTPRARLVRESITAWFELLRLCAPEALGRLKEAWSRAASNMQQTIKHSKHIHANVIGIMSNVIAILLKAGWAPTAVSVWRDELGSPWIMTGFKISPDVVSSAINRRLTNIDMARAGVSPKK